MQSKHIKDRRAHIGATARDNIWPLALVGAGIGWMLLSGARETESYGKASRWTDRRTSGLRERVGEAWDTVRDRADGWRDQATSRWSDENDGTAAGYDRIADYDARDERSADADSAYGSAATADYGRDAQGSRITDRARGMIGGVRGRASEATDSFWDMVEDHPLMAGIMGLALGAAIGATLPSTRTEDEWLGAYRDRLLDEAWHQGQDTLDRASAVARDATQAGVQAARDTARQGAGDQAPGSDRSSGRMAGQPAAARPA
ncbi:hypothetical protein [Oleisolibacter albus]|uniref:hypothetical protein n=1 Tax=Oleisolibacter albus TaxID=2171757 RepID=UPI000DF28833|nr:hypothetical protein [Oleisolibacter albus]